VRAFILPKHTPDTSNPDVLAKLKAKMHELHQTPGEFVKEMYKKH
jgi:hypothetical protein